MALAFTMLPLASLLLLLITLLPPVTAFGDILSDKNLNTSLLWGTYRPNLYLGIRPRVPDFSLIAGLMWANVDKVNERDLRHQVNISDGMAKYGWTVYDAREGGRQIIEDAGNQIDLTTDFIKYNTGNWGLQIKGTPRKGVPSDLRTTLAFYIGMENMKTCTGCALKTMEARDLGGNMEVDVEVEHPQLGKAKIQVQTSTGENGKDMRTVVRSVKVPEDRLWQAKSLFLDLLQEDSKSRRKSSPDKMLEMELGSGNLHFVHMACTGSFEMNMLYSKSEAPKAMAVEDLTKDVESLEKSFKRDFHYALSPKAPFVTDEHLLFSENTLSNLLGGLGFFVGTTKVDTSKKAIYAETTNKFWEKSEEAKKHASPHTAGPYELLSHVPSRAMFPRGFLWDEGFHLLAILEWDADLAVEVVRSWLALMDEDGWIAREQILGSEAEFATPDEFIVQYPHVANPPTMFLVISKMADMLEGNTRYYGHTSTYLSHPQAGKDLMAEFYPLLKRHYHWFRKSQFGDVESHSVPSANHEGYRWRGRTPETNFASGLDDYPRAEPPDPTELHLDALCWVGVMARSLEHLSTLADSTKDTPLYQKHLRGVKNNLNPLHWIEKEKMYCDTVVRSDSHTPVCHKGYVALFPLLTGFLDAHHTHLSSVLDLLADPTHLWTDHGVRSLSPEDKVYGVADNYWRSPIWININYMLLTSLLDLARTPGPEQARIRDLYIQLRRNIVATVFNAYRETGYVWEQYDPAGGHGQRTQHFTGWSALVVNIMAMPDLEAPEGVRERLKGYYEEAKKIRVRENGSGVEVLGMVVLGGGFLWVMRRRLMGTIRRWRRRV